MDNKVEELVESVAEQINWYSNACKYVDWYVTGNEEIKNYRREHAKEVLSHPDLGLIDREIPWIGLEQDAKLGRFFWPVYPLAEALSETNE